MFRFFLRGVGVAREQIGSGASSILVRPGAVSEGAELLGDLGHFRAGVTPGDRVRALRLHRDGVPIALTL